MTAQSRGPAEFDSVHDAPLPAREGSLVFLPVRRPVAAEDIRHFQPGTLHRRALRNAEAQRVEAPGPAGTGADPRGWWWSTPCWSRCADTSPSWPGSDDRAGVGWCARRFRAREGGPRTRGEDYVL